MEKIDVELAADLRRKPGARRAATLLNAACFDEAGHQCTIRVSNLSTTGLGGKVVEGRLPRLDEDVALALRSGKRVFGRVIWVASGKVGIRFDLPFDMKSLSDTWNGPGFEVLGMHANVGNDGRRPGLTIR